jgi:hypothetical protein
VDELVVGTGGVDVEVELELELELELEEWKAVLQTEALGTGTMLVAVETGTPS